MVYQWWPKDTQEEVKHISKTKIDMLYALECNKSIPDYWIMYKYKGTLTANQSGWEILPTITAWLNPSFAYSLSPF